MSVRIEDLPPKTREQIAQKMLKGGSDKKAAISAPKENKYHNKKTTRIMPDGTVITFGSMGEARRYDELVLLLRAGRIRDLRLQEDFTLREAYTTPEGYRVYAIRYRADFTYYNELGRKVVEDVKSKPTKTKLYVMKKKLMLDKFGLKITEVFM